MINSGKKKFGLSFLQICCLAGILLGVVLEGRLLYLLWLERDSPNWVETDAWVKSCQVKKHHFSRSDANYSVRITYEYVWKEREYTGSRYDFSSREYIWSEAQEIAKRYPPGKQVICYVSPDKPWASVLDREAKSLPLLGTAFICGWMCFCMVGYFVLSRRKRAPKLKNVALKQNRDWRYPLASPKNAEVQRSTAMTVVLMLIVPSALFGYFFLLFDERSWPTRIIGFVGMVAVILAIVIFIQYLANFKKTSCRVQISKPVAHLGDEVTLEWKLPGASQKMKLIVLLYGLEEFTFKSGKYSTLITTLFHSQLILNQECPKSDGGSLTFTMPSNTMPSTELPGGLRILWKIGVFAWGLGGDYIGSDFILPVAPAHLKERGDYEV